MNLTRYEFTCSDDRLEYYFDSVGPKGTIKKIVKFQHVDKSEPIYNLGFGDMDLATGLLIDFAKSNNGDRDIVMATVAATVLEFIRRYPQGIVYAKGTDKARTRLYQMAIASNYAEISLMFDVFGYLDGEWERFRGNRNYRVFCVKGNK